MFIFMLKYSEESPKNKFEILLTLICIATRLSAVPYSDLLAPINAFLQCETPDAWVDEAKKPENLPIILRDHLACEQ